MLGDYRGDLRSLVLVLGESRMRVEGLEILVGLAVGGV